MNRLLLAAAMAVLASAAHAAPYFHAGFNRASAGYFWPLAGGADQQQAGFITPVLEHDGGPGGLCFYGYCPGIGWNPVNLGYIGPAQTGDFLHGKVALGPSVQTGDLVKRGLRWACRALPDWAAADRYGALKSVLAPASEGLYSDLGVYSAVPLNELGAPQRLRPELYLAATLTKKF